MLGLILAYVYFMKTSLSAALLRDICLDVKFNRPIWAMLRVNEYLEINSPLRKAIAFKASKEVDMSNSLNDKIFNEGATLREFSKRDQILITNYDSGRRPYNHSKFIELFKKRRRTHRTQTKRPSRDRPSPRVQTLFHKTELV